MVLNLSDFARRVSESDVRLEFLFHFSEFLLGHGAFTLTQLLQLLSRGIKVRSRRRRWDLATC